MKGETFKIGDIGYYIAFSNNNGMNYAVGTFIVKGMYDKGEYLFYTGVQDLEDISHCGRGFSNANLHKSKEAVLTEIKNIIDNNYKQDLENYNKLKTNL